MPPVRLLLIPAILAAGVTSVRHARADPRAITWTVRATPDCGPRAAHFAREVELACDAVGHGCRVVEAGAERQAMLACPRTDPWTLEARTDAGAHLWTVALGERPESRLRVAAMWLARAERDAPPPDAPVIAAAPPRPAPSTVAPTATPPAAPASIPGAQRPPRSTGSALAPSRSPAPPSAPSPSPASSASTSPASRSTDAATAPPPSPPSGGATPSPSVSSMASSGAPGPDVTRSAKGPVAAGGPASDTEPRVTEQHANRGGLALALRGGLGGDLAPGSLGGSARAAIGLPLRTNASLVFTGEQALGAASGYGLTVARAGAGFGWGAPWSAEEAFGASLDAGVAMGALTAPSGVTPASASFVSPYAQLSVFGRLSTRGPFRPWAALSIAALADTVRVAEGTREVTRLPRPSAALDVGVAWAAW